jgi:hypothetical protein
MVKRNEQALDAAQLRHLLDYDPETGMFRWKNPTCMRLRVGDEAGSVRADGRRLIRIGYKAYLASRLAWLHFYGEWPGPIIDHIDRNKSNDAISNLRQADLRQNLWNRGARHNSSLGIRNIAKHKKRYVVRFFQNKQALYRKSFASLQEAIVARDAQLTLYGGAFTPTSPDRR